MRIHRKYAFVLFFLAGCVGAETKIPADPVLYQEPISFELNTKGGYTFNPITGDSIKPLINSSGDTIQTGIPVPLIAAGFSQDGAIMPKKTETVRIIKTIISDNIHTVPDKLPFIIVDTFRLKKVKLGEGDSSFVLKNTYGIVPTGIPFPVTGKKMPFREPQPVTAAPMRFKDNATTSIQYLDVEQGLGYSYVTAICEDKKGNIWFGVDGMGISKYDGVNITTYSTKEGLVHNIVTSIIEDRNNNIWITTKGGVSCFNGKYFTQYTEKEGLPSNEVLSILEDKKGNLWFSTSGGLTKYDGTFFTNYTPKEGLPSAVIYKCIEDRAGSLWIATYQGAAKFDGHSFTLFTPADGLAGYLVSGLFEDGAGNIWFGSIGKGLSVFDGYRFSRITKKEGLSDNFVWLIQEDKYKNIWISTSGGGLNKFDGKNFTYYKKEQGLSNDKVRGMVEDRNGNIWLATEGGGINKINATSFSYRVPEELVENNRIRPILKDKKGNLWFGTENAGFGKLNMANTNDKGKTFSYYQTQDNLFKKGQRSFLQDKNGNIWIGTTGWGAIKYDGKSFTRYLMGKEEIKQVVFDILEDKQSKIWFGLRDGSIVSYKNEKFDSYVIKQGLPGSIIYSMLEDKRGNIWFCTEGAGVYKYDGTNLIIYTEKEGLFSKSVTAIAEDEKGNIWLGTQGSGVCMFDGKTFTYYTEQQGLSNKNVWSAFCDSANQLWFGTDKGLTLFISNKDNHEKKKTNYTVYNFGLQDGLKAVDFNLHSVCVDNNNNIWWGTGKSVPSFDLNKELRADSVHSLTVGYIELKDQFYDYRNLPDSTENNIKCKGVAPFTNCPGQLSVSYDMNHLGFHFSGIDWSAPDKIKYSYRLIGLDETWSNPSGETMADYRNLRHGKYEFQIRAIGQSQHWTDTVTYSFIIRPAWWQTWWFKSLIVAAILTLVFFIVRFIYRYQLRKQRTVLEKQLAVQYERQRISTEMHDDIGAGLSGIRLLTEMTKNKVKDEKAAGEVEKIYQSVGEISAKMKEVIWSLNTENDSLSNLVYYIQKQTRNWLENFPCRLIVELPEKIPAVKINGETRRNIVLMIKEATHNIIKHSEASEVNIKMSCSNENFSIIVSDNGKGLGEANNDNSGNGMRNMHQRVQQLNGKIIIENQKGLTLLFEIPIQETQ